MKNELQHHELVYIGRQSNTSITGSARDTPPAQRPLPALPVSPPPPQLPPRENRDSSAQRTPRVTNGNAPSTGSVSPWLGGGAPPTTNLDDDWNTDSEPRRRAQRQDITDLSDVMANLRPCECFLVPRSLILAHAHFLRLVRRYSAARCHKQYEPDPPCGTGGSSRPLRSHRSDDGR